MRAYQMLEQCIYMYLMRNNNIMYRSIHWRLTSRPLVGPMLLAQLSPLSLATSVLLPASLGPMSATLMLLHSREARFFCRR